MTQFLLFKNFVSVSASLTLAHFRVPQIPSVLTAVPVTGKDGRICMSIELTKIVLAHKYSALITT